MSIARDILSGFRRFFRLHSKPGLGVNRETANDLIATGEGVGLLEGTCSDGIFLRIFSI
jgi:hypothetical protein